MFAIIVREPLGYLLQKLVWATVVFRKYFPVLSEQHDPFEAQHFSKDITPAQVATISQQWKARLNRHQLYYPPSQHKWFGRHEALALHYAAQNARREAQIEAFARECDSLDQAKQVLSYFQTQARISMRNQEPSASN